MNHLHSCLKCSECTLFMMETQTLLNSPMQNFNGKEKALFKIEHTGNQQNLLKDLYCKSLVHGYC